MTTVNTGYRYPKSILTIPQVHRQSKEKLKHTTQKPVTLFEYLIKTYTNQGAIVLDNVAGSGTCGIACLNTKRDYIMIEKDKDYYDMIIDRINNHKETIY